MGEIMKRTFHGNKSEADALDTYTKLMRASERISAASHQHLTDHDLTISQFAAMEALYHLGPLCQREIGRKILKSRGNITTVINNLEKKALVKRQRDSEDRRFFSVTLTALGEELISRIFPQHVAGIVRNLNSLTPAEQHELARLCRKLGLS
jgi:MarR family transcriptional regulator, 2-MHQ and catechol-resistance regulon repressor